MLSYVVGNDLWIASTSIMMTANVDKLYVMSALVVRLNFNEFGYRDTKNLQLNQKCCRLPGRAVVCKCRFKWNESIRTHVLCKLWLPPVKHCGDLGVFTREWLAPGRVEVRCKTKKHHRSRTVTEEEGGSVGELFFFSFLFASLAILFIVLNSVTKKGLCLFTTMQLLKQNMFTIWTTY